jgi:single-stranded-DNA-specific exonuclease
LAQNNLTKRWVLPDEAPLKIDKSLYDYPRPIRQILYNRGYKDLESCRSFLNADYPAEKTDPMLIDQMDKAVDRILETIHNQLPIAIYGDYDVDGVTATALLVEILHQLGACVIPYIPNRFEEGYGLNKEALKSLREIGIDLVVTVDCGIRSVDEADYAREIGISLIISDHHHPRGLVPDAAAVVCPKKANDRYEFKELSGVGLAFKIAQALLKKNGKSFIQLDDWLDFVALGSVADMVPLVAENRMLVRRGMEKFKSNPRIGLKVLAETSKVDIERMNGNSIGFGFGPRLNAAGRMESAKKALQLLMVKDERIARQLAEELNKQNLDRQVLTKTTQQRASEIVRLSGKNLIYYADSADFNQGILGLAASRLTEEYYRPAMVATRKMDGTIRASCRSIPEFDITGALDECVDLLIQHGGHKAAAGFTIHQDNLGEFLRRMEVIAERELGSLELNPVLKADAQVSLTELKPELFIYLEQFEPVGMGNPAPIFYSKDVFVKGKKTVGKEKTHLSMLLSDGQFIFDAIGFGFGGMAEKMPDKIDILFAYEKNYFQEQMRPQLRIIDIKFGDEHSPL